MFIKYIGRLYYPLAVTMSLNMWRTIDSCSCPWCTSSCTSRNTSASWPCGNTYTKRHNAVIIPHWNHPTGPDTLETNLHIIYVLQNKKWTNTCYTVQVMPSYYRPHMHITSSTNVISHTFMPGRNETYQCIRGHSWPHYELTERSICAY